MTGEDHTARGSGVPTPATGNPEPMRAEESPRAQIHSGRTIVLWALTSMALVAYVALGSVPAYIWRFGRLYEEAKPVLGIWTIEADNLPRVSRQWMLEGVFNGALIIFLTGAVVGFWFLLAPTREESRDDAVEPAHDPEITAA